MSETNDKTILVVTTFKEQNTLESSNNVSNIIASSEPQKTLSITTPSSNINNLVVTNTSPSQIIIQPNQTLNIVATKEVQSTVLSVQTVGPALSGPQGIQGIQGPTGPTGPVDFYVRTLEGLSGNIDLIGGRSIIIGASGSSSIVVSANKAQTDKSYSDSSAGVAVFDSDDFRLGGDGIVRLNKTSLKAQSGNFSSSDDFSVTFRGGTGQAISTQINGGDLYFNIAKASTGVCGVAYYDSSDFNVASDGKVTLNGAVRSLNGCTGLLGICGTSGEVEISQICPNIIIGLPDSVNINNLSISGSIAALIDGGLY